MGQAFRRATGRIASSRVDTKSQLGKIVEQRPPPPTPPPVVPVDKLPTDDVTPGSEDASKVNAENVLEDRDPQYDVMLNQMVGRIRSKPGGKLEMGQCGGEIQKAFAKSKKHNTRIQQIRGEACTTWHPEYCTITRNYPLA